MALYHFSVKPISRKSHGSAVAAAAYRTGQTLIDGNGVKHKYPHSERVSFREIIVPDGEPLISREELWKLADKSEKRKDGRVAREFELALQHELSPGQNLELVEQLVQAIVKQHHVAVDVNIHNYGVHDDNDNPDDKNCIPNVHVHIMMTTREYHGGVLTVKTDMEREDKALKAEGKATGRQQIEHWREMWADIVNDAFARHGVRERICHLSLATQGIKRPPQKHEGPKVNALRRRGIYTTTSAHNQAIKELYPEENTIPLDMDDELKINYTASRWNNELILQAKYRREFEQRSLRNIEKQFRIEDSKDMSKQREVKYNANQHL